MSGQRLCLALSAADRRRFIGDEDQASGLGFDRMEVDRIGPGEWERILCETDPAVLVTSWGTPPLPQSWLISASCSLRYVCHIGGSVRTLVPREFIERGGLVSNWGRAVAQMVAEHALLLALAALRNAACWRAFVSSPGWRDKDEIQARSLFGRRVGIHGYGAVAAALIALLRPFGVKISAYSDGFPSERMLADGVHPCASLAELFAGNEILVECEALTERTRGAVSREVLGRLPPGAVFVNVGRGQTVDETALIEAARAKGLRIALDVAAREPLSAGAELLAVPGAILSPHMAGPTPDGYGELGRFALRNVARFLRGEAIEAPVDLSAYDRST